MALSLNQFLLLVLTIAAVVAATFLVLLMTQLRRTAREAEETLVQLRSLAGDLRHTNQQIQEKIDDAGELVAASKKAAAGLSEIAWFLATRIVKPTSKYWPLLFPLMRVGWRQWKKRKKEDKNGR